MSVSIQAITDGQVALMAAYDAKDLSTFIDRLKNLFALFGNIDETEMAEIVARFTAAFQDGSLSFGEIVSLVMFVLRAVRSPAAA